MQKTNKDAPGVEHALCVGDFHTILNGNLRRHIKQADVPRCPVHGVEMRPSSYGKNQWYCSQCDERTGAYRR
jgi:hypothetical protein